MKWNKWEAANKSSHKEIRRRRRRRKREISSHLAIELRSIKSTRSSATIQITPNCKLESENVRHAEAQISFPPPSSPPQKKKKRKEKQTHPIRFQRCRRNPGAIIELQVECNDICEHPKQWKGRQEALVNHRCFLRWVRGLHQPWLHIQQLSLSSSDRANTFLRPRRNSPQ